MPTPRCWAGGAGDGFLEWELEEGGWPVPVEEGLRSGLAASRPAGEGDGWRSFPPAGRACLECWKAPSAPNAEPAPAGAPPALPAREPRVGRVMAD
jgi:hypothetical protein